LIKTIEHKYVTRI